MRPVARAALLAGLAVDAPGSRAVETMAHSVGEVVEVLDASSGWLPARVLRRHEDGAYDVSVNLDETIHLGDAAACLSLLCAGDQESKIRAALGFYLDPSKTSLTLPALRAYLTSIFKVVFEARNFSDEERTRAPSPRTTGDATARRCFRRSRSDGDRKHPCGRLCAVVY